MNHFLILLRHLYWSFIDKWIAAEYSDYAELQERFSGGEISAGFGSGFTNSKFMENK